MNQLYTAAQVRELDRIAIHERGIPGIVLMKRAAEACVRALLVRWPAPAKVVVLCGSGNNAGDGYIVAGLLASRHISVQVVLIGRRPVAGSDAASAYQFCIDSGVEFVSAEAGLSEAEVIVDALLGTGLNGSVRPDYAEIIERVNDSGIPVVAVDLPSGLCADTGNLLGPTIKADVTVTFIANKIGLMTADGPEQAGEIVLDDLAVPTDVCAEVASAAEVLDYDELIGLLKPRHRNAHKVSHGHVLIIGGDHGMPGAVSLAAEAALYSGAGLVTVATRAENVAPIVSRRPEVMARGVHDESDLAQLLERATVIVLGPGLGRSEWSLMLHRLALAADLPSVVDADGLNILAENPVSSENWVLTPHPGEATRLAAGSVNTSNQANAGLQTAVQADRQAAVARLQAFYGGTVLLKGAGTLIAADQKVWLSPYGNPGMSVAGMGDLLAGTIGALLAQGLDTTESARLGAVVHSLAADELVLQQGERGLLASELLPLIRQLLNGMR